MQSFFPLAHSTTKRFAIEVTMIRDLAETMSKHKKKGNKTKYTTETNT